MVWQYVIGGALVGAAVLLDSDEDHHDVVQQTVNNLEPELPEHAHCTPITSATAIRIHGARSPVSTTHPKTTFPTW